jgi:hypothetical protein
VLLTARRWAQRLAGRPLVPVRVNAAAGSLGWVLGQVALALAERISDDTAEEVFTPPSDLAPAGGWLWPEHELTQRLPRRDLALRWSGRCAATHEQALAHLQQLGDVNLFHPGDVLAVESTVSLTARLWLGLWHPLRAGVLLTLDDPAAATVWLGAHATAPARVRLVIDPASNAWIDDAVTGRVLSVSQEDLPAPTSTASPQLGQRAGTRGRMLPGLAWEATPGGLTLRGASLPTAAELRETVHFDAEGFVQLTTS